MTFEPANEEGEGEVPAIVEKTVIRATSTEIEFKMTYSIPLAVSRNPQDPDLVSFKFREDVFSDPLSDYQINNGRPLIVSLPRQIDAGTAQAIEGAMAAANGAGNAVATGNLVINILLGASLKFLWGMINTLQFVVFFTEWNVQMPPNAILAIKTFRVIALGEFIPSEWLTNSIKNVFKDESSASDGASEASEDEEEDENDEEAGSAKAVEEDKSNVLANMGVMLVILLMLLVLIVIVLLSIRFCKKGSFLHTKFEQLKKKLFWNSFFRFVLQSYLKTVLGCLFAIRLMSFATGTKTTSALISLFMLIVLVAAPIFISVLMHRNRERLPRTAVKSKIGSLYLGTRTETFL